MAVDTAELKRELLRMLREDEEFRLAVAGLLGLDTVISELRKLREDFNRLVELEDRRWEENWRRWEENNKRWEENERRWQEAYRRFEAIERKLLEHDKRFDELERRVSRVELSLGALTEVTLTRYAWEEARLSGETIIDRQRSVILGGLEVDLLVETDRRVYVVEVKVKPTVDDLRELLAKADAAQRRYGRPAVPVLAGTLIGSDVRALARSKGVRLLSY